MEREYTLSTGMKIFYGALAIGIFIFSMVLFDMYNPSHGVFILIIPLILVLGSVLIFVNIVRRKIVVYNDSFLYVSLFYKKELSFQEIKGYRLGEKVITLESDSANISKITINNYIDFAQSDELTVFIKNHFKDLNAIDLENERNKLLQDPTIGFTEHDREEVLANAKKYAITYNCGGIIVCLAAFFFDNHVVNILLMTYPLIGLIIILFSKGLIKFLSNTKRSAYRFIGIGFTITTMIILAKAISNYNIFIYDNIWLPSLIVGLVISVLILVIGLNKSIGSVAGQIIFILIISLIYGFASTIETNCAFDNSELKIYPAVILDHRIQHGKSDSYYLTLSNWGPSTKAEEVDIHKGLYQTTSIGDTVKVNYKKGLLNIPWFIVTK